MTVQDLPCNAFSWCGDTAGCFEPDIHRHEYRDCWLKFTEAPLVPEVPLMTLGCGGTLLALRSAFCGRTAKEL